MREIAAPRCVEIISLKDLTFGIRERAEIPVDTCKIAPVLWWEFEYFLSTGRATPYHELMGYVRVRQRLPRQPQHGALRS